MTRRFDRPTTGNLKSPAQVVRYFDKLLTVVEANFDAADEASAALAAALAAAHTADWSGVVDDDAHKPEDDATYGADLATNVSNAATSNLTDDADLGSTGVIIDPFPLLTIYADSAGVIKSAQLPKELQLSASQGGADVTTAGTWSRTATAGITCSIGAATGLFSVSAMTGSDISVPIGFAYPSVSRTATVRVLRQDDPPTNTGSSTGGTTASTTTLGDTTGTAYDTTNAVSDVLTVTTGSVGSVDLTAPITFARVDGGFTVDATGAYAKWQWRVPAGAWADVSSEVAEDATAFKNLPSGSITGSDTKSGLAASTTYEFRLLWRRRDSSGTASNIYRVNGTMTASGS